MTPSLRFSKTSYASSILESGKRWVIRGVTSTIFPGISKSRISPQSHPSTPPRLEDEVLAIHIRKRKHLRLVIHRNDGDDGIRTGTLPGQAGRYRVHLQPPSPHQLPIPDYVCLTNASQSSVQQPSPADNASG